MVFDQFLWFGADDTDYQAPPIVEIEHHGHVVLWRPSVRERISFHSLVLGLLRTLKRSFDGDSNKLAARPHTHLIEQLL
jgi:hypothetical protein